MLSIKQSKITLGIYFATLVMFCVVTVISPNFDVKSIIIFFLIMARGLFPKLLEKALIRVCSFAGIKKSYGLVLEKNL